MNIDLTTINPEIDDYDYNYFPYDFRFVYDDDLATFTDDENEKKHIFETMIVAGCKLLAPYHLAIDEDGEIFGYRSSGYTREQLFKIMEMLDINLPEETVKML